MAKISAKEVNKLRQMTGIGMMDCKKALEEAEGDFDNAIEILRKKGQKLANKRADKDTNEGIVLAQSSEDRTYGAIFMLNCETDFVAKNGDFVNFAKKLMAVAIAEKPTDLEAFKKINLDGRTVDEHVTEMVGKTGEKLVLSNYGFLEGDLVVSYIHHGNRLASLVKANKSGNAEIEEAVYNVAMQVAAMAPAGVDENDVPDEVKEKELELGREQARQEGKPDKILDKIAQGKLNKFLNENTLLNQEYIKEAKTSVRQYLSNIDKELTIVEFKRFALGE
jgi:elongation factor Ts